MREPKYLTAYVLAGASIFLYLQLFILPHLPVLPTGDQTIYLFDGRRMADGQVPYRDFFQFVFPGTAFVYSVLFKAFGVRAWVSNTALLLLGVGFAGTSLIISRKLFAGASIILPGFLFLAIPYRNAPMGTGSHHWYSALAVMTALAVLMESRTPRRLAVAGALCGLSAWFNQTRGAAGLLGFAVFLLWEKHQSKESWRSFLGRVVPLLGTFLVTLVALSSYFVGRAGLKLFLYSTVVFPWKYFPDFPPNRWGQYAADMPPLANWHSTTPLGTWLVIELLVPWIYFLFFWRAWRTRKMRPQEPWDGLALVSIVGLCLALSVAPSAMNYRLCTLSLPAVILLVWFAQGAGKIERITRGLVWIGLLALMVAETYSIQTRWHAALEFPIGRVACLDRGEAEEFQWFLSQRGSADFLLSDPVLSFPLGLRNPTPIDFLSRSEFTRPEQVRSVIEGLERERARWVNWGPFLDTPDGPGDHLAPLRTYLRAHYHLVNTFDDGDQQILERNEP